MSTPGRAPDPALWNIPKETRWTQNGGRRIGPGDVLLPGEVVVTGMGTRCHQTTSCLPLAEGRATAKANGYVTRGFFAVSYKLANRFVGPCKVCWSDPSPEGSQESHRTVHDHASDGQLDQDTDRRW
jgi:hypothetical protein